MSAPFSPLERKRQLLERLLAADQAQDHVLDYVRFTMPDPKDLSANPRTRYLTGRHHELLAAKLHELLEGNAKRVIVNMGPRHGKTELASKKFAAYWSAKNPEQSLIFGTYNETYAGEVGSAVRDYIRSAEHQLVFPDHQLREDKQSTQRLQTTKDGILAFVGRGGSITGRGGHGLIIDDPIKDRKEADSKLIRDQLWTWFTQVVGTRLMTDDAWIMLIQTRWHEDDLVGRLTDPMNPFYDPDEAKEWVVVDLPALALENDILGRHPGEALWPERFGVDFLNRQRRLDPRGFQALYQGRPTAEEGAFFQADWLKTYKQDELPSNLRYYCASDHAVSTEQRRDKTAMIPVGVDEQDNIYVLPTVQWGQFTADVAVDKMLSLMQQHQPAFWWAERGQITKSLGPFLRKRMNEEQTYAAIIEVTPIADKQTRAQSIQGRVSMGKVFFPSFAPWWPEARDQILKFPHGTNDDFVDALAYIGLGLNQQVSAANVRAAKSVGRAGSFRRMLGETRAHERAQTRKRANEGW